MLLQRLQELAKKQLAKQLEKRLVKSSLLTEFDQLIFHVYQHTRRLAEHRQISIFRSAAERCRAFRGIAACGLEASERVTTASSSSGICSNQPKALKLTLKASDRRSF